MVLELLVLALCLPGVVLVSVMILGGASIPWFGLRLMVTGLLAAAAWASLFFQGLGYIRSGGLVDAASPQWLRLAGILGPIPAAAELVRTSLPSLHSDVGAGIFPIACLAWIPALHLELVRLSRRRSNNRWRGP
jgi:hypothetical protein